MNVEMQQRVSVITLGVESLDRSRTFYESMGWSAGVCEGQIVFFQLNGLILALYPREALAEDAKMNPGGAGFKGITLAYNTASHEETDVILARAVEAGGQLVKPAQKVFWGGYSGYFADPDGHLWEVAFNPFWRLDEEGNIHLSG
ncbi:VOC family protein [Marinobacterium maritimum]|uniref:VOC family protein n=1 Tax=Marinobacterium maritimum TaxID=500162 RepID=A0ABN1I3W2_9GAMM